MVIMKNMTGRKATRIIISLLWAGLLLSGVLVSCNPNKIAEKDDSIKIVTTIFPEYDWVRNIMGEKADDAEITLLLDNGADIHSYALTFSDMAKITDCDLFIYVGGESDEWVDDVLKNATNKDMIAINLLEVLGDNVKEEEVIEGMEAEEEEEDEGEEVEKDEHVWLSLRNASIVCDEIADALVTLDPDNKDLYLSNLESYKKELSDLDNEYKEVTESASTKTLLFADRFPFRYLVDDYDLDYYAAFVGCSTESEASFQTIVFLSDKVDELNIKSIMTIEGENKKIAEAVRDNTTNKDQEILTMNSIQSVSSSDIEKGITYLSIMKDNLEVIKKALN